MKLCSKTDQITPFKKNFSGKHTPNPRLRPAPANPAYAYELLPRNLFEEMRS